MSDTTETVTTVGKTVNRITDNKELVAINKVDRILSALTPAERSRVMGYIGQKVGEELQREFEQKLRERQNEAGLSAGKVLMGGEAVPQSIGRASGLRGDN